MGPTTMNINDPVSSSTPRPTTASGTPSASTAKTSSPVPVASQQFSKVDKRLQADVETTTAKLSKFGLLKSAVASAQVSARGLTKLPSTASPTDVTAAMGKFVNSFQTVITATKAAATVPGTGGVSQNANRVANDVKRALSADPASRDAMRKLGASLQPDGSMAHDAKKFAAALASDPVGTRAAMAILGKKLDDVAGKELSDSGPVANEMASLTRRNLTLAAQQKAMTALKASMVNPPSPAFSRFGLAAYQTQARNS